MFESDLFISYAHLDNEPVYSSDKGWVDAFHSMMDIRLSQLLGRRAEIWRDPKLQGNDHFSEKLLEKISQAAIFIGIISPRYIKSEWCLKELQEFHKHAERHGGGRVGDESRVFKVVKTQVERDEHPKELQGLLGYDFFEFDKKTDHFWEFDKNDEKYERQFEKLAQDISKMIKRLGNRRQTVIKPSGKTIYLAEPASDMEKAYIKIKDDLQLHGHRVLPDKALSHNRHIREEVSGYLTESQLSVHLIGKVYGVVPDTELLSIVGIQREMASEHASDSGLSQIIWMPQGLKPDDARQQTLIDELSNHSDLPRGAVLLQNKLEDLKTLIHERLNPPPQPSLPQTTTAGNGDHSPAVVYVICDKSDYQAVEAIEDYLFQNELDLYSLASGASLKKHIYYLEQCDAVLLYCGNATDKWLETKRMDLLQIPGYKREKPLRAKAFYFSEPETRGKNRFKLQGCIVIPGIGEFPPVSLKTFVNKIKEDEGNGNDSGKH